MRSEVVGSEVVFRLADPGHDLDRVRLWQELGYPGETLDFVHVDGGWELRLPRPDAHRMEYLLEVTDATGTTMCTDPSNPRVVGGAFGDHSWLAMPEYAEPGWVGVEPVAWRQAHLPVKGTPVGVVDVHVWAPADVDDAEPLPLLLAHDGPEFATYAGLTHYVGAMVADGTLPPLRVGLLAPGERDPWYSANPDYAAALTANVLPRLREARPTRGGVVLAGASLGGLAALHAEWTTPGSFAGLLLQSGSFFTAETDPQERGFSHFAQVEAFVQSVLGARCAPSRARVAMTCGSVEENAANNRVMARRLRALGLDVDYAESADAHNFTSWRDVLDPHLTRLLTRVWCRDGGARARRRRR